MNEQAFSNFEAEQSALGAAIRSQNALKLVVELDPAELYYPAHRLILQAMKELYSANDKVDLVTLDHKLGAAERIKAVGGINYIVEIVEKTPSASGIKSYIGIIKDCAGRRKLKAIGEALIKASDLGLAFRNAALFAALKSRENWLPAD
jgi:replicative DNA helicase